VPGWTLRRSKAEKSARGNAQALIEAIKKNEIWKMKRAGLAKGVALH
jgi:hypothetical protein